VWAFIPNYESALAINALATASLLFVQFAMLRSRALLVLAGGYLFTAAMAVPHALTYPGLFTPTGLLGAGSQSTAWLYIFWRDGFPLLVIGYALLKNQNGESWRGVSSRAAILCAIAAVLAAVCALTALATAGHALLPEVMANNGYTPAMVILMGLTWSLNLAALVVLWVRRPHTVLDLWLMVTMCACVFDVALSALLNGGRFDLGFYAGRVYGLLSATFVLLVLLRETGVLYARLARMLESEQRERRRDIEERRRLFETSLDLILVVDRDATIKRVNASSIPILGYAPDEMIGRHAGTFLHPDDLNGSRKEMRKARRGGIIRNFESRYIRKDGRAVILAWTGLWSEPDQLYFFFGRDMTEQKLLEEKFQLAVESSPSGMVMLDAGGTIFLVNAETEKLFGYRRNELIGQSVDILVPLHHRAAHRLHRDAFAASPASLAPGARPMGNGRELRGLRKDGSEFPVEVGLNPIHARDGLMILSTIIDVSERKRIERLKDEFVSTVSHELRTPLTSIAASLGLLTGDAAGKLPDRVMRLVTIAYNNSQRLVRLINDILDVEKIESGKITFHLRPLDVLTLVEQAIDANRGFAEGYGVRIRLDDATVTGDVRADSDRLMQVVTNLLSNAIKFSPRGGEVFVAIAARDGMMRISVRDHGAGIPEEFKPRIFEKFAQADASDARQKGGTGLGLSIVKQIVIRLDGKVGFEDAPGGGTVFYVDLPQCEPMVRKSLLAVGQTNGLLLICDDCRPAANLLAEQLGTVGFMSDIATTGAEIVERAATTRYAAILIDLQFPDCDGISLIQQLRAQPQNLDTPIVVVSSDPARGRDDERSSSLDVLDWLQKPVDIGRLVHVIDRAGARDAGPRLRVLHVDDDPDALRAVGGALNGTAEWVPAGSIEAARRALATDQFDLVVIDVALAAGSGLDLLPELHDREGNAIPVIVLSAQGANPLYAAQVRSALTKSRASIEQIIATLRKRATGRGSMTLKEKETA
jgi:PAS domain S-box-containing protein